MSQDMTQLLKIRAVFPICGLESQLLIGVRFSSKFIAMDNFCEATYFVWKEQKVCKLTM